MNDVDYGVIGRPMYSDKTLHSMSKEELIRLLHLADSNHDELARAYQYVSIMNTLLSKDLTAETMFAVQSECIRRMQIQ